MVMKGDAWSLDYSSLWLWDFGGSDVGFRGRGFIVQGLGPTV